MNKLLFIFLLVIFYTSISAQDLDSLYNEFIRIKTGILDIKTERITSDEYPEKCGFGIVNQIRFNYDKFSTKQKQVLSPLLSRPITDTSFVSPRNLFRIHFNKSNFPDYIPNNIRSKLTSDQIPVYKKIYLDSLAIAADSAYNYEVNILRYPAPPSDYGEGGDALYDIYIASLSDNLYGYIEFETKLSGETYTSFMVIDNDFSTQYTKGIDGARVTVAHELHHAIQIGNYIYRESDIFYHEITSTSMEEFVYDSINDYYNYINSFMLNPNRAFAANNGYNLAIWNLFLRDRFDVNIIKKIWEQMRLKRTLNAMADAIAEAGSSFKNEYSLFGQWVYFTGMRSVPNKYFEEAAHYPIAKPLMVMNFLKPLTSLTVNSNPVSLNYLFFVDNSFTKPDTLVSVISNVDITNGVGNLSNTLTFKYNLSNQSSYDFKKIVDGYFSKIECNNNFLLAESNILNNVPINEGEILSEEIEYAYPQPFRYSKDNYIYFPAERSTTGIAELYIYSVDMNLVYSGEERIYISDKIVVRWNVLDNSRNKLSSGIYIYVVRSNDKTKKGKFVVYND